MDKDELWKATLATLLDGISENDPKSVFLNLLSPVGIFGNSFVFLAQNSQVEEWVNNNYLEEMEDAVEKVCGTHLNIGIGTNEQSSPAGNVERITSQEETSAAVVEQEPEWMNIRVNPADLVTPVPQETAPNTSSVNRAVQGTSKNQALFSKCTFDTFVVGPSNEFARGASLAVAEQPGTAYNPLFIYGQSGLGKTHLLVAIANYVMQNLPHLTTVYVSANDFLNDYVTATQKNKWDTFNRKYHGADVLLIDDVQYLEGREETINQLFNIFNEMTNENKQIVLSADRAPAVIDMDERMRSRFVSGVLADVKPPNYETRLAILKNFLSRINQQMDFYGIIGDDVLEYLADASTSNIREIEGAVTRIITNMSLLRKDTITVEEAKELLRDFFPDLENRQIDISAIMSEVERFFHVSHEDMISQRRTRDIANARHIAIYLSRYLTEESLESIGRRFGGRDHTTIMHSVQKIEHDQQENRMLFEQIEQLMRRIKEHG